MTALRKESSSSGSENDIFYPALEYIEDKTDDKEISKRLQKLKAIISEETNIRLHPSTYDDYYIRFLRITKNDIKEAAKLYIRFCELRTTSISGLIKASLPSLHMKDIYRNKLLSVLKERDSSGRAIIVWRTEKWDPKVVSCKSILAASMMLLDEVLSSLEIQLHGVIFISDQKGYSLSHARCWSLDCVKVFVKLFQDYPIKSIEVHLINTSMANSFLLSLFKKLMSENLKTKVHVHGNNTAFLQQFVHPDYLPTFLGGQLSENDYADMDVINRLESKDEFYKDFFKYGSQT